MAVDRDDERVSGMYACLVGNEVCETSGVSRTGDLDLVVLACGSAATNANGDGIVGWSPWAATALVAARLHHVLSSPA
jgi:hypothetical protein